MIKQKVTLTGTLLIHQQIINVVGQGGSLALRTDDFVFVFDCAGVGKKGYLWP